MTDDALKTKVYNSLRLDVVSGKLPGGTTITETEVADILNVSRTPVRQALLRLFPGKTVKPNSPGRLQGGRSIR